LSAFTTYLIQISRLAISANRNKSLLDPTSLKEALTLVTMKWLPRDEPSGESSSKPLPIVNPEQVPHEYISLDAHMLERELADAANRAVPATAGRKDVEAITTAMCSLRIAPKTNTSAERCDQALISNLVASNKKVSELIALESYIRGRLDERRKVDKLLDRLGKSPVFEGSPVYEEQTWQTRTL
jgi:hypothetical protein